MELPLRSLHGQRRAPNWVVAAVAGFAAGAVLMVLDLLWSSILTGGPWRTSHMIAPIFIGADAVRSTGFDFSVGIVAIALAVHYVLGIAFGLVLAAIMVPLHLDATVRRALVTGAVFGLILYVVNFFGMVRWFPWLADLRGWATIAAHLVFGMVAALLYRKLEGRAPERQLGGAHPAEAAMLVGIVLIVLIVGSVLFHFLSPWYLTPIASNWTTIDDTIAITFWVTGIVYVAITIFMALAVIRYRYRPERRSAYEPENKKLEWWLLGLTTVGVAAMLAPGLFVWAKFVDVPADAAEVEALGQQWHWMYRFPGQDGKLGTVEAKYVSEKNPFGLNPADPSGQDDILIANPELHLPLGKPIKLLFRSKDVLHNFSVAQIRVKMDLVPGLVTYAWFTPTRTGTFDLLCEELCGIAHFAMRGRMVIEEPDAFAAWLARHPTFAQTSTRTAGDPRAGQARYAVCAACHGPKGEGNAAMNAPKLSGQGDWYLKRQLVNYKQGARGTHEKDTYGKMMAPMAATLPDETAIEDVVAYIMTLPDTRAAGKVRGDAKNGRQRYTTCAACHGSDGRGIALMNAPRLKGMNDWYLVTQLKNFRDGIRGAHPQDFYGYQMSLLAAMLTDDQTISDLAAYISSIEQR
jgi:cytochrome c oxidase subunit 2